MEKNSSLRILFIVWGLFVTVLAGNPHSLHAFASKEPVRAKGGMVVSAHHLATEAGLSVLKRGGNAMDAAIATGFALAVVYPSAGNLGGGGFMLVRTADGNITSIDFREKAPLASEAEMYLDENGEYTGRENREGWRSIAVPGTVAGFYKAHEKWGSVPIKDLIQPAVELAEKGFPLSQALVDDFEKYGDAFLRYPPSAQVFLKDGRQGYQAGDIFNQPDLARTLKIIQTLGRDEFYQGEIARLIVQAMEENGGLITRQDLERYEALERKPVHATYRGYDIFSMGPPSAGGVTVIEILNILEGFDLKGSGFGSVRTSHILAEAMRRAFRDRAIHLGDPAFNPDMPLDRLLSKNYAQRLRQSLDPDIASKSETIPHQVLSGEPLIAGAESKETTHYSVIDGHGNAVVVTMTLEQPYGSKLVAAGTGFLLNNEMGDFNPWPGRTDDQGLIGTAPNLIAPEKRMLSSMAPTIVAKEGKPYLLIGSPGGRTIINTVVQIIVNVIDFEMDIAEAIAAGRIHHAWFPDVLKHERFALSPDAISGLEAIGHRVEIDESSRSQGGVMGILVDPETGFYYGSADPRKYDASAAGI